MGNKMYIIFGTWQVRFGQLRKKSQNIQVRFSGSTGGQMGQVAPNQQVNIHFSMERVMRIMN
jgi:hypothetical protein